MSAFASHKRILFLLLFSLFARTTFAQPTRVDSGTQPSQALAIRCVDITGTIFEPCGGSGGGSSSDLVLSGSLTSTACPGSGCLILHLTQPTSTVIIDVGGPFNGRVTFASSADGILYHDLFCDTMSGGGPSKKSDSVTDIFQCNVAGLAYIRVWQTIYFAGSADVVIRATIGSMQTITDTFTLQNISSYLSLIANSSGINGTIDISSINGLATTPGQLDVNCLSGCGSPPATADGTAFVSGTTNVSPGAFVVDDVATTTVPENSYGAARMTTDRLLYTDLSKSASNTNAFKVDGSAVTQPVSGTFWQATQPVSGTFWQATQPISAAALPLPTGAAADATLTNRTQKTQITDGTRDGVLKAALNLPATGVDTALVVTQRDALPAGSNLIGHVVTDATSTTAVTQLTASNLQAAVQGTTNSGSSINGNPVRIGASFNTTQPTVTNGQVVDAQSTARGAQIVATGVDAFGVSIPDTTGTVTVSAANASCLATNCVNIPLNGAGLIHVTISGVFVATMIPEAIGGASAVTVNCQAISSGTPQGASFLSFSATGEWMCPNYGWTSFQVRTNAYTSGSPVITLRETLQSPYVVVGGFSNISATQGLAATAANAWTVKITDGTNIGAVKAASTASVATDPAQVVTFSPNTGLPTGANVIGHVIADSGSTTAVTGTVAVNLSQVGATTVVTGGVAGTQGVGGVSATNTAITQNPVLIGVETISQGSNPTAATSTRQRNALASTEGVLFTQSGGSNTFSCFVQAVTVLTECKAAPAAGLRAYVTSVSLSNQAATVQTLDIAFGTGSNCATGTTALTHKWQMGTNATTTSPQDISVSFITPLVPTAANAICVRPSAATAFGATITGYIAP